MQMQNGPLNTHTHGEHAIASFATRQNMLITSVFCNRNGTIFIASHSRIGDFWLGGRSRARAHTQREKRHRFAYANIFNYGLVIKKDATTTRFLVCSVCSLVRWNNKYVNTTHYSTGLDAVCPSVVYKSPTTRHIMHFCSGKSRRYERRTPGMQTQ